MTQPGRQWLWGLSSSCLARVSRGSGLARRLPRAWTRTPRRRRLLFIAACAPGFLAVFATPAHRNLAVLVLGLALFGAACLFRGLTEPVFAPPHAALTPSDAANLQGDSHHA